MREQPKLDKRAEVEQAVAPPERTAAEETVAASPQPGASLDVRSVLALQRSAGNAAVARLVQQAPVAAGGAPGSGGEDEIDAGRRSFLGRWTSRGRAALARQPKPPPPGTAPGASAKTKSGLVRGDFTSAPPSINLKGGPPTAKRAGDKVELAGPGIEANAKVTWSPSTPGGTPPAGAPTPPPPPDSVNTGFIQTVLHSDRAFLYTEDGKPGGKVGREVRDVAPEGSRDARALAGQKDSKGKPVQGSGYGPFYQTPRSIKPGESTDVVMTDEPTGGDTPLKLKGSDGKEYTLARVAGSDQFRLSVGVAEASDNVAIHLAAKEWTVPWDMDVVGGAGAGSAAHIDEFKGKLEDIKPGEGWATADAQRFPWPRDEAEAQSLTSTELIKGIPFAERADSAAWTLMCGVLRARNPTCHVTLNLKRSSSAFYDRLTISIAGPRTATKSAREWGTGAQEFDFRLLELMDPRDLKAGLPLTLSISRDDGKANTTSWPWPFGGFGPLLYYWDAKDAPGGEDETKKSKVDAPTEISVTARGFG